MINGTRIATAAAVLVTAGMLFAQPTTKKNVADALSDFAGPANADCTVYVVALLKHAGFDTEKAIPGKTYTVADAINMNPKVIPASENLKTLVESDDKRTSGVVTALVDSAQGTAVAKTDLQRGDVVQYWYMSGSDLKGHTAVVLEKLPNNRFKLRGSQQGTAADFTSGFTQTIKFYAVRPTV